MRIESWGIPQKFSRQGTNLSIFYEILDTTNVLRSIIEQPLAVSFIEFNYRPLEQASHTFHPQTL